EEAAAMENCVRTYGEAAARGWVRLWSVRKDGVRVATLEVTRHESVPLPFIRQLQLAKNAAAPVELWLVAGKWMGMQDLMPAAMVVPPLERGDTATWRALWKPYWLAMRDMPWWLPVVPDEHALDHV